MKAVTVTATSEQFKAGETGRASSFEEIEKKKELYERFCLQVA